METLHTPRLKLRPPDEADAAFVMGMYRRHEVMRWIGDGAPQPTHAQALQRIARYRSYPEPFGGWLIELGGRPLGFLLCKPIPWSRDADRRDDPPDIEIGWHLHPDAWGIGYATEAAQAVIEYVAAHGVRRLVAVTHPDNEPSRAVCGRLGMRSMGATTDYYDERTMLFERLLVAPDEAPSAQQGFA